MLFSSTLLNHPSLSQGASFFLSPFQSLNEHVVFVPYLNFYLKDNCEAANCHLFCHTNTTFLYFDLSVDACNFFFLGRHFDCYCKVFKACCFSFSSVIFTSLFACKSAKHLLCAFCTHVIKLLVIGKCSIPPTCEIPSSTIHRATSVSSWMLLPCIESVFLFNEKPLLGVLFPWLIQRTHLANAHS